MNDNTMLFVGMVIFAALATWMALQAVYWKVKYFELRDEQQRRQRARTTWPPIA